MIKVGDEVKITGEELEYHDFVEGTIVTIIEEEDSSGDYYVKGMTDYGEDTQYIQERHFKKINPKPTNIKWV